MNYENFEYADMIFCYGLCNGNATEAAREYGRRFPDRGDPPDRRVFSRAFHRLRETGSVDVNRHLTGVTGRVHPYRIDERILRYFEDDPTISTRTVARIMGISQWKVWSTVNKSRLHPFHYTTVQGLLPQDHPNRVEFCEFILDSDRQDPMFLKRILWTDECKFGRSGTTNYHNLHYWSQDNPHAKIQTRFQVEFNVNVWAGVIGNTLVGPYILPDRLNGENYLQFLINVLPILLDDVPLLFIIDMIFQHDGCPAHYHWRVREWLDANYPESWIGRGGPMMWPPRSPDLTPLDYYVWGTMKEYVYKVEINNRDQLLTRILEAAEIVRHQMSYDVTVKELRRRSHLCIRERGSHFEHI